MTLGSLTITWLCTVATVALACALVPSAAHASEVVVSCQNTSADTAAISAAIAGSSPGDEIVIQGRCLITAAITLLGDRSYRGESRTGTVLKQADGANLPAILASDSFMNDRPWTGTPIAIRHLRIDGNRANNTESVTNGIALRSWLSVVEDVLIENMGGNGILLTNKSLNGTGLQNTQVNGRISGNFIQHSGRHGIFVEDTQNAVTDWQLMDNWIADSGADAIHMDNAAGWFIQRNHLYGVRGNAVYANRLWGTSIADNYIEDFGAAVNAGTYAGIVARVQGGSTSTIIGNRISSGAPNPESTYRYIDVSVNYGTAVVTVAHNVLRTRDERESRGGSRATGLYYDGGSHTLVVTSTGNLVHGVQTPKAVGMNVIEREGI